VLNPNRAPSPGSEQTRITVPFARCQERVRRSDRRAAGQPHQARRL